MVSGKLWACFVLHLVALTGILVVNGLPCDDLSVSLRPFIGDDGFGHHGILGRYKVYQRKGFAVIWKQLNGRYLLATGSINEPYNHSMAFIASFDALASVSITLYPDVSIAANTSENTTSLNGLIMKYSYFNTSEVEYRTTFLPIISFDCLSNDLAKEVTVCTGERVFHDFLYRVVDNEVLNDPANDTFSIIDYIGSRPLLAHSRSALTLKFGVNSLVDFGYPSWELGLTSGQGYGLLHYSFDFAMRPESTMVSWRFKALKYTSPVNCKASLNSCTQCDSNATDVCLSPPEYANSTKVYCVCSLGYEGEKCDRRAPVCSGHPSEILGRISLHLDDVKEFYSGEVVTIWCDVYFSSIISNYSYDSVCLPNGTWSMERECVDYSLLPSGVYDPRSLSNTELLKELIAVVKVKVVEYRKFLYGEGIWVDELWIHLLVSLLLLLGPILTVILHLLVSRLRSKSNSSRIGVLDLVLIHCYGWSVLCAVYIAVCLSVFSSKRSDSFGFLTMLFAVMSLILCYIYSIASAFLSKEWTAISSKQRVELGRYLYNLEQADPVIAVTVECYHNEKITKRVRSFEQKNKKSSGPWSNMECEPWANEDYDIFETGCCRHESEKYTLTTEDVEVSVPVVTAYFTELLNYKTSLDFSHAIKPLRTASVSELELELQVSFGDAQTKQAFIELKEAMIAKYKHLDENINVVQSVKIPGLYDSLKGKTTPKLRFYMNKYFFVVCCLLFASGPLRLLISKFNMNEAKYKIVKQVYLNDYVSEQVLTTEEEV